MSAKTRWWYFGQNNSGGSFESDPERGIGYGLFIEATNKDHASARAQDIGLYFNGVQEGVDCGCCGDRWSEPYSDGSETPTSYGEKWRPALDGEDAKTGWGLNLYIHPIDGGFCVATEDEAASGGVE